MVVQAVRCARLDDMEALLALCSEHMSFERARQDIVGMAGRLTAALFDEDPRLKAWIGTVHERPVGYATATEEFSTWSATSFLHMDCLFVRAGYRGSGLGAALLQTVRDYARCQGLQQVQWQTPAWNVDASRFYQRQGAVPHQKVRFCLPVEATGVATERNEGRRLTQTPRERHR
jgi:GNAT superfamily N-acetyltransferase